MFSRNSSSKLERLPMAFSLSKNSIPSIIAADLKITGNLICSGAIEIEGSVEGNITCSQVTVRKEGSVKGDIVADIIQIDGEIQGLLKGKSIIISETGRVTGVIMYESLSIRDGAFIDGKCKSSERLHRGKVETLEIDNSSSSEGESVIESELPNRRLRKVKAAN